MTWFAVFWTTEWFVLAPVILLLCHLVSLLALLSIPLLLTSLVNEITEMT